MRQQHVHILAVCGYTTSGLALMAKKLGYFVTGSDEDAYPPISVWLSDQGIKWHNFHSPQNLKEWGRPDLVIQGNQIRKDNPELKAAKNLGLKIISDSEFFYNLTRGRKRIVVCGTHGKTTTSALITWILARDGRKPGFRLGTITKNFKSAVSLGKGKEFVFEGDEYTTTFADKRPKFFHFSPHLAVINNIEWDHPDVFKSAQEYVRLFRSYLVARMPRRGLIIANVEDSEVVKVIKPAKCRVVTFGLESGDFHSGNVRFESAAAVFDIFHKGENIGSFKTILPGYHNIKNCLAAAAACYCLGVDPSVIKSAIESFEGTSRRFEIIGREKGVTVVDDYAHHPTKARETIAAARGRYPQSRIFVIYTPHTYTRTKSLLVDYGRAFLGADFVIIPDIEPARERHLQALIHSRELVGEIKKNQRDVFYIPSFRQIVGYVCREARRGDVVLCMSVRGFDGLAARLVKSLKFHEKENR